MRTLYGALAALAIIAALLTVCAVAIDGPSAACNHVTTSTETAHERTC